MEQCEEYVAYLEAEVKKQKRNVKEAWGIMDRIQKDTSLRDEINRLKKSNETLYFENQGLRYEIEKMKEREGQSQDNQMSESEEQPFYSQENDENIPPTQPVYCMVCQEPAIFKLRADKSKYFCGKTCYKNYKKKN